MQFFKVSVESLGFELKLRYGINSSLPQFFDIGITRVNLFDERRAYISLATTSCLQYVLLVNQPCSSNYSVTIELLSAHVGNRRCSEQVIASDTVLHHLCNSLDYCE